MLLVATPASADKADFFGALHIEFKSDLISTSSENQQLDEISIACSNIGDALLAGRGPQGLGVFKSFSCESSQPEFKMGSPPDSHWHMTVHVKSKKITFALQQIGSKRDVTWEINEIGGGHVIAALGTKEVSQILALKALDLLPAMLADHKIAEKSPLVAPPGIVGLTIAKIRVYSLRITGGDKTNAKSSGGFLANICGTAVFEAGSLATDGKTIGAGKWTKPTPVNGKNCFYGHSEEGPGALAAKIDPFLKRVFSEQLLIANSPKKSLMYQIAENFSGGYVGMRFGLSVLNESVLLRKSNMVGILTEFRKGFLSGLRLYIDYAPKARSGDSSLAWSRVLIGKSFFTKIDKFGLKVDLTPKIGRWTYKGDLPVSDTVASFNLNGELSLGLEFGLEYETPMFVVRTWTGFDRGFSLLGIKGRAVTSKRGGVDAFWKLRQKQVLWNIEFSPALLAFAFTEQVDVNNGEVPEYTALGEARLNSLEYVVNYAGGGIAVAW